MLKVFDRTKRRISDLPYTLAETASAQYAFNLPTHVLALAQTANSYLIGSTGGLWMLDKRTHRLDKYPLDSAGGHTLDVQIRHIRVMADSSLLLSTHLGLYEVRKGAVFKRYPKASNMGVFKTIVVGDTIWLATQGNGLVALDSTGRELQTFTTGNGLSDNLVYSLEYANGIFVAGTADGLNLLDGHQMRRIGTAEGLAQSEFNSGASFWDAKRQQLYMGGLMGYTRLDMEQPWFSGQNRLVSYVTEIHTTTGASDKKVTDYTWAYRGEHTLVLNPGESLTGLYIGTPGNHHVNSKIRYALNDGSWEPLNLGQFISLIEPSPGKYRFRVETLSTTAAGSEKIFSITKLPHFYETWWFNALILLSVAGVIGGFFRYREAVLQKEKKMRIKIASDLHDEVGSSLTRIYLQADLLLAKHNGLSDDKQLQQIAEISKQALFTMSDIVWSIDSRFDTVKDLVIRMKDYLYKLREELEITYRFEVKGDQSARAVSQLFRQNLLLIFKEAVTNAVKYGGGSEINIEIDFRRVFRLTVRNRYEAYTGAIAGQQGGRGLDSMCRRAARIGGRLSYTGDGGVFVLVLVIT